MKREGIPLGLFHGLSIEDYHASPEVSNSGLSDFARSPFHYAAFHLDPERPEDEETPAQLVGNLAHCMILEPEQFMQRYAVGPVDDRRLKAWKDWEALKRPAEVRTIKPCEYAAAQAQAASVRRIPDVAALLAKGEPEVSAFWLDPATNEPCRCRPDWVHPAGDGVILADLKTTSNASPQEFARQVARMGYHRQAAFYSDGYAIASGKPVLGFVFVAVETAWPYAASAVMLDEPSLAQGRAEIAELLPVYAECRASGRWPGYAESIELISLPAWALTEGTT